jgi:hypothetical protein
LRNDDAFGKPGITQGTGHGLGHAATAAQGKGRARIDLMRQQLAHGQVGVVGLQVAIGVDQGIDRLDGRRRRVDFIDQRHAASLYGIDTPQPRIPRRGCRHRRRQVIGAHGLVVEVQAQLLVQVVVKAHAEGAGAAGQGNAARYPCWELST